VTCGTVSESYDTFSLILPRIEAVN
jgi:hypothetical protein